MIPQAIVWQKMKNVFELVEHHISKDVQRLHGIGLTEYRALQILSTAPRSELRMQELANRLGLNQSSVTRLVERMERNNYTIRDACPKDKRGVYTVITKRGRQIQTAVDKDYDTFLNAALDESARKEEHRSIVNCLRQAIKKYGRGTCAA